MCQLGSQIQVRSLEERKHDKNEMRPHYETLKRRYPEIRQVVDEYLNAEQTANSDCGLILGEPYQTALWEIQRGSIWPNRESVSKKLAAMFPNTKPHVGKFSWY